MVKAVVGANWGDEGKGKITDMLAREADIIIRFQGGANAGHTIVNDYGKFALHTLPSGVFYRHTTSIIGNGVALNIPVFINEMVVRLFYSIRRLIKYYTSTPKENRNGKLLWKTCEPFSNATVKRMLTVAHGTFCLIDIGDVSIRAISTGGGTFNAVEFFMRLNIIGIGRFTISIYGEIKRGVQSKTATNDVSLIKREKIIVDDYISGLTMLSEAYDDKELLSFVADLKESGAML